MHANLVRTSALRRALQQTVEAIGAGQIHSRLRRLAVPPHDNVAFAILAMLHIQWRIDQLLAELPVPDDKCQIVLLHLPFSESLVQLPQCAAALRHHQATRGLAIDTMYQRQILKVRSCMTQEFDDSVANTATTVDRDTSRLVQYQQTLVLENHTIEEIRRHLCGGWRAFYTDSRRRNSYLVTLHEFVFGADPTAIDSYLSASQQTVHPALGHTGQLTAQKIIDTLPCPLGVDRDFPDLGMLGTGLRH